MTEDFLKGSAKVTRSSPPEYSHKAARAILTRFYGAIDEVYRPAGNKAAKRRFFGRQTARAAHFFTSSEERSRATACTDPGSTHAAARTRLKSWQATRPYVQQGKSCQAAPLLTWPHPLGQALTPGARRRSGSGLPDTRTTTAGVPGRHPGQVSKARYRTLLLATLPHYITRRCLLNISRAGSCAPRASRSGRNTDTRQGPQTPATRPKSARLPHELTQYGII